MNRGNSGEGTENWLRKQESLLLIGVIGESGVRGGEAVRILYALFVGKKGIPGMKQFWEQGG